jgi:hypothetical protein
MGHTHVVRPMMDVLTEAQGKPVKVETLQKRCNLTRNQIMSAMTQPRLKGHGVVWSVYGTSIVLPLKVDDSELRDEIDEQLYQEHVMRDMAKVAEHNFDFVARVVHKSKLGDVVLEDPDGATWLARKL